MTNRFAGSTPAVSVIMSAFNALPFLRPAVQSVLDQTFEDLEFLIVNDGSTDGTGAVLDEFAAADRRVRIIHRENGGYASALNQTIEQARGGLLARMDADDICRPTRLERQVEFFREMSNCVALGTWALKIDPDGAPIGVARRPIGHEEIVANLLRERQTTGTITHPSAMLRRAAMEQVGGYRPRFEPAEDRDLWLRLAEVGRLANLPEVLLDYRVHPGSVSSARSSVQRANSEAAVRDGRERRGLPWPPPVPYVGGRGGTAFERRVRLIGEACGAGHYKTARRHVAALRREGAGFVTWLNLWTHCRFPRVRRSVGSFRRFVGRLRSVPPHPSGHSR